MTAARSRPSSRSRPNLPAIAGWLQDLGLAPRKIDSLTGDVSLRRYFRAHLGDGSTAVVAYYPVQLRPVCRRFRFTTALLGHAGVLVPEIRRSDCRRGLMLLDDTGDRTLYDEPARDWDALAPIYRRAADYLRRIQALPRDRVDALNVRLDAALLRWELRKSWELVLVPRGLVGPPEVESAFAAALDSLCDELGREERLRPCHRDFMPRNLMLRDGAGGEERELVVLDHQDLRLGPPAYDLASLLNDSLFPPRALEDELLTALHPGEAGALDYRRAVVQRSIKAVGNYCDFARRGFDRHLNLVAPTLARAWRWFAEVPELRALQPALRPAWEAQLDGVLD
jgi:aminoglycoside/choline kinase family phosphotransferase